MSTFEPVAQPAPESQGLSGRRVMHVLVGVGLVFLLLAIVGLVPRLLREQRLQRDAAAVRDRVPMVSVTHPRRADVAVEVPLPGSMEPLFETAIYARTDGYLKSRAVDIGDRVTKGQLLADIDTPEINQQLNQARATLAESKANVVKLQADLALARTTLRRYVATGPGAVSKQEIDERASAVTDAEKAVDAAQATVNANEANVQRLTDLQGFQKVYAPFAGIITERNVDPGALISSGSTNGTTRLFSLAQVDVLRIFVYAPQSYAPDIKVGQLADVAVRELPGRVFPGTVTRTAGAIDPASRTMRVEVQVPNPDGTLVSGSYATVRFKLTRAEPPVLVPSNAVLFDSVGVRVAVVDPDGSLHYRPVQLGRDDGENVEVLSGIDTNDVLAIGVAPSLADGNKVEIAHPAAPH
jgi:RND family efflux transporter MFP subunit